MLQTKEQIKKAIVDYLGVLPKKASQVEEYTVSTISEKVKAESSKVEVAIAELKDEGLIDVRKVQLQVCVPKNPDGSQILATFANKKYITFSPYWSVSFGFAIFFCAILALGKSIQPPTEIIAVSDAYVTGLRYGIVGSFSFSIIGGMIIQNALTEFRRWQIVSEKIYKLITDLVKHSAYIFVPLFIVYCFLSSYYGQPVQAAVVATLLGVSVATSVGYEGLRRSKL